MEYKLPKEISKNLNVTLKTVYNYLKRYPDKIRTKKDYWKTFVNLKDFEQVFHKVQNPFTSPIGEQPQSPNNNYVWKAIEWDAKFQKELNSLKTENQQLIKRKDVLERQIKEYGELYLSEKEEKKERVIKYDALQVNLNQTINLHNKEKTRILKKYYTMYGMSLLMAIAILIVLLIYFNRLI